MGLAASNARLLMLYIRKGDTELRGQFINTERSLLASQSYVISQQYAAALADGNPDNDAAAAAKYEAQSAEIHMIDQPLEMELKNLETEHQELETEIDAVKKVIDKNIEKSFKTFG